MGTEIDIGGIGRDQRGIIAGGDVKNARLINTGDVSGSYNAIGDGAKVIVNQALSRIQELQEEAQEAERRLSQAIEAYVQKLYVTLEQPADADKPNPYKSLLSYELEDAPFFYGRDEAIDELLDKIHQGRLTILHADSGSGKSSLLKAGIVSRLLAAGHLPLWVRPYDRPPAQDIKQELLPDIENFPELARLNQMSLRGFLNLVSDCLGPSTLYIFLDQFEEFFDELRIETQKAFAADLAACLKQPGPDVRWVLSMRKEAFSDLDVFRPHIPSPYENDYFLKQFDSEEARDVIVEPALRQGVTYEDGLVEIILQDLHPMQSDVPITSNMTPSDQEQSEVRLAPPQVQLICYTLFDEWRAAWRKDGAAPLITKELYQKPRGGLQQTGAEGILTGHLSSVLERMGVKERKTAHQILEALVTSRATRVIISEDDLVNELKNVQRVSDEKLVQDVLDRLIDDRLVSEIERQGTTGYELAHDYLLSQIELDPATQARKAAQEMLNQEVAAWRNNPKLRIPADKLDIVEAQEDSLVLSPEAKELLRLSREALQRQKRIVFAGGGVLVLMIIAAVVLVIIAIGARGAANVAEEDLATATIQLAIAEVEQTRAASEIAVATEQLGAAEAQQATAESAVATATAELADLDRRAGAIGLALQSLENPDPEQALVYAIESANKIASQDIPWQTQKALMKSLDNPLRRVLAHENRVGAVAFSPDGTYVLTGSGDGTARIWSVETGQPAHTLVHEDPVWAVAFSPDGVYALTGSRNGTARIWSAETGQPIQTLEHVGSVEAVTFSPDGAYALTGSGDGARIWSAETGLPVHTLAHEDWVDTLVPEDRVRAVAFSPDGAYALTGSDDRTARIWSVETGQQVHTLAHEASVYAIAFSPDGAYALTGSGDGTARIWSAETGLPVHTLAHEASVYAVAFSPDGVYALTGSEDGKARIWSAETGQLIHTLAHEDSVRNVAFSPDGAYALTGSRDGTARIWSAETGQQVHTLVHEDSVDAVAFSPDGVYAVTGSGDGTARIWSVETGQPAHTLTHENLVRAVAFSSDGAYALTGSGDEARIWSVETDQPVHTLAHLNWVNAVAFSPDGVYALTGSEDWTAGIWSVETGQLVHTLAHENSVRAVAFSPDGVYALTGSGDGARIWSVETGQLVRTLEHEDSVGAVAFSPDGVYALTGSGDGARIWSAETGQLVRTLVHENRVGAVAFSPDGVYALTGSGDGTARIWSAETGQPAHTLVHEDPVWAVAFSPDGVYALTGSGDGTARIWSVETGLQVHALEHVGSVEAVTFSPDGVYALTGSGDSINGTGAARIWHFGTQLLVEEAMQRIRPSLREELEASVVN